MQASLEGDMRTIIAALRRMAYRHLEDRIVPQRIAIVGVLVARRDRKHPQPKHLLERVLDALGLAPVADARRKARRQPELLLDRARSRSTPASDDSCPPSNPTLNFLRANRWKIERQGCIVVHDGCGE